MRISITLFFCFFLFQGHTQVFNTDRQKFVKEIAKTFGPYITDEDMKFVEEELNPFILNTSSFSNDQFTKMIETSNAFYDKDLSIYPDIFEYMYSYTKLLMDKHPPESLNAWQTSLDNFSKEKSTKKLLAFLNFTFGLINQNIIGGKENEFYWFIENGEFTFEYTDQPLLKLNNDNLICRYPNVGEDRMDIVLTGTSGTYYINDKEWKGKGGIITWEKSGLSKDSTYAEVNNYEIDLTKDDFNADSTYLTTKYFSNKILGKISDEANDSDNNAENFPEFTSYDKKLTVNNILPNINYQGGFMLKGNKFVGQGTKGQLVKLSYIKDKTTFFTVASESVSISPKKVMCLASKMVINLSAGDSITHPHCDFVYNLENGIVEFRRTSLGLGLLPFVDSYHQLNVYVPVIQWNKNNDHLSFTYDFGTSQEQRYAYFESSSYFSEKSYAKLKGSDAVHPLNAIYNLSIKNNTKVIQEGALATGLNRSLTQLKPILIELNNLGFVSYDQDNKLITINEKLENYVNANEGNFDYDNILFECDMRPKDTYQYTDEDFKKDPNLKKKVDFYKEQAVERRTITEFGKLSLKSLDLELFAIDKVTVSESKNTNIFPDGYKVTVGKNRDFQFTGWINSGKIEIKATSANYSYTDHKINLLKTEAAIFRVKPLKPEDGGSPIAMNSSINGIKGEILVDNPLSRSGKDLSNGNYPILKSTLPSYVFYNYQAIFEGAYDSTRFYYTVNPFELDSLNTFVEKNLKIKGELTSAGIFPKIKQDLVIMPDYSLGFSTTAPSGGYDFYGTGAKYDNKIVLSNNGLQGAGTINFVQSTSVAKLLTFLPDSTVGTAQFKNNPVETGIQFPDASCEAAYITYYPKKNQLKAASTDKAQLSYYKDEAKLTGEAIITPAGMTGNGYMYFKTATTFSTNYKFSRWNLDSDTSNFSLKNSYAETGESDVAFKAENVKCHVSFKDRKGEFVSNQGGSVLNFPVNQYACKMDKFSWILDQTDLQMENSDKSNKENDLDLAGPNFYSLHPKQDSLTFAAPKAKYDLKQRSIFCENVEFLAIADAKIYPDSMKVTIRKDAYMEPFKNAKVVANYVTKYHRFERANIEVKARREFSGEGEYAYYDKDSSLTYFKIKKIEVDDNYQTIASGAIDENQGFQLSKEFDFYGKLQIFAAEPFIHFDGATRIHHDCQKFDKTWMSFNAPIDPKNIQIPVSSQMKNLDGTSIAAGIVWRDSPVVDSIELYPTFLSKLSNSKDPLLISADGFLQYNEAAKEFQIGSKEKLLNRSEKGNFLALHTESCSLNGEGRVNLGMDYGDVIVDAVGVVNYNQSTGLTSMNLTVRFDMALDKGVMQDAAERIAAIELLKPLDFNSNTLEQALVEWTDQKTADKIKSDYSLKGEVKKVPDEFEKAIVLTGLKLDSYDKASTEEKGLISSATTASLVCMFGKPVMKNIPVRAFFQQIYSGSGADDFSLQLQIPGMDYYFDYEMTKNDGLLRIITTDNTMVEAVNGIKEEKRKTRKFNYEISTQNIYLTKFLRLFE